MHPGVNVIEQMADLMRGRAVVALTGAGCSTESGIPDYRGPLSAQRVRAPVQYQEFLRSEEARARYWSRSMIGWSRVSAAVPNPGHSALAELENAGIVRGVITQNVDGLHQAAGSRCVVELHGSLARVRCLACGKVIRRDDCQARLIRQNPAFSGVTATESRPDGDAEVQDLGGFRVPDCACGGIMKPDVVFFGESVPTETVATAWRTFAEADVLLVLGSSLTVYSGRRFIYRAQEQGVPIAIVNIGPTRADHRAVIKVEARTGLALPRLVQLLCPATCPHGSGE